MSTSSTKSAYLLSRLSQPEGLLKEGKKQELHLKNGQLVLTAPSLCPDLTQDYSYGWTQSGRLKELSNVAERVEHLIGKELKGLIERNDNAENLNLNIIKKNLKSIQEDLLKKVDKYGQPSSGNFFSCFFKSSTIENFEIEGSSKKEQGYLNTKEQIERSFENAIGKIEEFTDTWTIQAAKKVLGLPDKIFFPVLYIFSPKYQIINALHQELKIIEEQLSLDPKNAQLQQEKDTITLILSAHDKGTAVLESLIKFITDDLLKLYNSQNVSKRLRDTFKIAVKNNNLQFLVELFEKTSEPKSKKYLRYLLFTLRLIELHPKKKANQIEANRKTIDDILVGKTQPASQIGILSRRILPLGAIAVFETGSYYFLAQTSSSIANYLLTLGLTETFVNYAPLAARLALYGTAYYYKVW